MTAPLTSAATALSARDVHKAYGRHVVLAGVDLTIRSGEMVGIVGENGAGKSTLLRILCGDLRPDKGSVTIHGTLGHCPQHPVLNNALTPFQHLSLFQEAFGLRNLDHAHELIDRLAFADHLHRPVKVLSGGTRQKLNLVLALMHDPDVVLLDEPYQGFDWQTYLAFWDLAAARRAAGRTTVVISHLAYDLDRLDSVIQLTDKVAVLTKGADR
ncbi:MULTISPECIES: ABC transporter ATP-binding protein [unclassified Streptomyces]|uniref:ABC transporter ATP-binding protein n=1 Tax=unclassified Streptomyces TaxID=2593676 RepID=UPI002E801E35|nr:ABC transporter ATP-binding protein [Streptomyces sp. NBC_00589]WTI37696.1 ABC transporter ATP-binding protein [Streptomyces sp. NBC_00775]WUB28625.1 ABC transporter ATP-binding protein [Streptomyces sp. NBC_00589]